VGGRPAWIAAQCFSDEPVQMKGGQHFGGNPAGLCRYLRPEKDQDAAVLDGSL